MQLPLVRGRSVHASCPARRLPRRAYFLPAAAIGLASLSAAQTVDGTIVGDGYPRLAVQACNTTFGDNVNELNGGYGKIVGGKLYLAFTGNIGGANVDKLDIFLDVKSGGENVLTGALTMDGANAMSGLRFDSGFDADYLIICRQNDSLSRFDVDVGDVVSGGSDAFADVFSGSTEGASTATIGSPSILTNGIDIAYDDSNIAGIDGTGATAATRADAAAVQTGVELCITLSDLGYTTGDDIRVCAFINNAAHTFVSNQVLGSLPNNFGNLATSSTIVFDIYTGDQFFTVSPEASGFDLVTISSPVRATLSRLGDLDNDGDLDLVCYSEATDDITYLANDGSGGWSAEQTVATLKSPTDMALGDVDGDGDLDVVIVDPSNNQVEFFENTFITSGSIGFLAGSTIADASTPGGTPADSPVGMALADFDSQGDAIDIVVGYRYRLIYIEDCTGSGSEIGLAGTQPDINAIKLVAGDFDQVGGPDIAVAAVNYRKGSLLSVLNSGTSAASWANLPATLQTGMTGLQRLHSANYDGAFGDDVIAIDETLRRVDLFRSNGSDLNTFPTGSVTSGLGPRA